ncbi:MAG: hypothetical protein NVSMB16_13750 [Acidimicrobiales bacterium]
MAGRAGKLVDLVIGGALKRGIRQGLGEGKKAYLILGGVAMGVRVLHHLARAGSHTVVSEELLPGQSIVITHLDRT